jgi:tRNA (guanine-N7-)-methyltransferase
MDGLLPRISIALPKEGEGQGRLNPDRLFATPHSDLWLEIGFGSGEHLLHQALTHRDVALIGCEPFVNGMANLLMGIEREKLDNIRVFPDDGRLLLESLPDACLGRVFILFSDPWRKKKHHKRRLIGTETVAELSRVMKPGAELRFASDHMNYIDWALDHLTRHPDFVWCARRPADWRQRPADACETRYEAKALAVGRKPAYLRFERRARPNP